MIGCLLELLELERGNTLKQVFVVLPLFLVIAFGELSQSQDKKDGVSFKVIVNVSNPTEALKKDQISRLFLKKTTTWSRNQTVQPLDLPADSPVRKDFTKLIHGRSISAVKAYWQRQIFTGDGVPPPEKNSDEEVIKYVRENTGAIGYVSNTVELKDVKILKLEK